MVKVKICGIQDPVHALAAAQEGVDFVGIVFAPSRRQVTLERATEIVKAIKDEGFNAQTVGVFADQEVSQVNDIARACSLDWVQLSGNESMDYCREVPRPILKTLHVPTASPPDGLVMELRRSLSFIDKAGYRCLLDSSVPGMYGGSGKAFSWDVAQELAKEFQLIMAGGLTPVNVAEATNNIQPWGVDVSSGVETAGQKDPEKIRAFIRNAKG